MSTVGATTTSLPALKRGRPKKTQLRKVCILGYAEESRDLVFQLDESWDIWGINAAHYFAHKTDSSGSWTGNTRARSTNWFQLHPRDWKNPKGDQTGFFGRPKEHLEFLQGFEGTVWLQEEDPDIPNGKRFPLEEISREAGRSHFTSTFAYQLGMLWYQHRHGQPVSELAVYGVNLSSIDEYIHQKSCVSYWLGRLEEAGVKLNIPVQSALLKGKLYAYGQNDDELGDHVFEQLQQAKSKYIEGWANVNTSMSMKTETKFWANVLSKMSEQFPDQFTDELKGVIQNTLTERTSMLNQLTEKSGAELNGSLGMTKAYQHMLSMTGGIDHRAPQLPELRVPTAQLEQEFEIPKPVAI